MDGSATPRPGRSSWTPERVRTRVAALGPWFHNMQLMGVWTAPDHFLGDYPNIKWRRYADAIPHDLRGMTVSVQKEMSSDPPRRIVALPSELHIPLAPDNPHREVLEQTALNCPVHKSLPAEIRRPTKFFWEG